MSDPLLQGLLSAAVDVEKFVLFSFQRSGALSAGPGALWGGLEGEYRYEFGKGIFCGPH
jgi:hypothetical protein